MRRPDSFIERTKRLLKGAYSLKDLWLKLMRKMRCASFFYRIMSYIDGAPEIPDTVKRINLKTYDGTGQTVHPDILYEDGFYVLAVTPFPYTDDRFENPCVFLSQDGIKWTSTNEKSYPIAFPQKSKKAHTYLSDSDIIYTNNEYWLYYREHFCNADKDVNRLYKTISKNLYDWEAPCLLFETYSNGAICPSIVETNNKYYMFFVRVESDKYLLMRTITDDGTIGVIENVEVENMPKGRSLWHVDIVTEKDKDKIYGLFTLFANRKEALEIDVEEETVLYYAESFDYGSTWRIVKKIDVFGECMNGFKRIYRSSMTKHDNKWDLAISAETKKGCWYTYLIRNFEI